MLDTVASIEYLRRTGWQTSPEAVIQLAIGKLNRANQNLPYPAKPGALGQALQEAGLSTAVIGNGDSIAVHRRLATTITMDKQGLTDFGLVDRAILLHEDDVLGGLRTNFAEISQKVLQYRDMGVSLIVVETGDVTRLYEERDRSTDQSYAKQRAGVLNRIDDFVGDLTTQLDFSKEMLLVVSPTPTYEALRGNRNLTLMVAAGPGFAPGSLLTSGTTKRDGIVKNTDIAPTILKALGLEPVLGMSGRPLSSSNLQMRENTLEYLQNLNDRLVTTYQARPPVQSAYVMIQIVVLFVALFGVFFRRHMAELIKPFLLLVMAVPLAELLIPFCREAQ
ncbi:hypothetical protein N752_26835 [Desulforamulus aquiferis]|nr:hypothetical protein [Desulforamulus aquiferis]RYD02069.1 hypothetical protein N752_26835 [Desulforamulus aquiferis]